MGLNVIQEISMKRNFSKYYNHDNYDLYCFRKFKEAENLTSVSSCEQRSHSFIHKLDAETPSPGKRQSHDVGAARVLDSSCRRKQQECMCSTAIEL